MALGLAACGGGGGAGSAGGGTDAAGGGAYDPTIKLVLNAEIGASTAASVNALALSDLALASAGQTLELAQLGVDLVHRLATPGGPSAVTVACAGGGSAALTLQDRDGNGIASGGDAVIAVLAQCGLPVLQRRATGTVQVDILQDAAARVDHELQARINLGGGLALETLVTPAALPSGTLAGSVALRWTDSETGSSLSVLSSAADDLTLETAPGDGPTLQLAWRKIAVVKQVRWDDATVSDSLSFVLERNGPSGRAVVITTSPWQSNLNQFPTSGTMEVRAGGSRVLRLRPQASWATPIVTEVIGDGGKILESNAAFWQADHAALHWDGRRLLLGGGYPVQQMSSVDAVEAPRDLEVQSTLFPSAPGATTLPAIDHLFVHPVLQAPGSTSPDATFRWQIGTALEDAQPLLHFRFSDGAAGLDPVLPRRSISAVGTRRGALYLIRPDESLHHGTSYALQSSTDGVNWQPASPAMLRKRNGELVNAETTLAYLSTPGTLLVSIDRNSTIVVGADDDTSLRATVTTAADRGVASVHWEQRSGQTLLLDAPNATVTRVRYPPGAPRQFDSALFTLTVTDTLGDVERADVVVSAGDVASTGAVLYQTRTLSSLPGQTFRTVALGAGEVRSDTPQPGLWGLLLQPGAALGTGLYLGAPDGAALTSGAYDNSTLVAPLAGRPVMACLVALCTAPAGGRFDVLEIAYAADGSISRLAVDYEQVAPDTITETVRGSYRFNSDLPVRR